MCADGGLLAQIVGVRTVKLEWVGGSGWVGVGGAHLEGIYCIIQSIIAAVGA